MSEQALAGSAAFTLVTSYVVQNVDVWLHRGALTVTILSGCLALYTHFRKRK